LARELASVRMALGEVATRDFIRSELTRIAESDGRGKEKKPKKKDEDATLAEPAEG